MVTMTIRRALAQDLPRILQIYAHARVFMAEHGNPNQWKTHKPTLAQIENDIANGNSYVCVSKGEIHGVFCFFIDDDPTYSYIIGEWKSDERYGVVHRIASSGEVKGVGTFMMNWAFEQHSNIRIDTHKENYVMQNMLKKLGYEHCGTIFLEDGDPRMAFQKVQ